jgi:5'-nucleotidase
MPRWLFAPVIANRTRAGVTAGLWSALAFLAGCTGRAPVTFAAVVEPPVRLTIVQLNDVYEITSLSGGKWGGPARVATLLQRLEQQNPNTIAVLAGDFLSPSALGTATVDGSRLDGRQMVDVLNAMGLDYVTIGNHEFDLRETALLERLRESRFQWISSNVTLASGAALPGVVSHVIVRARHGADSLRVGLIGVTMDRDQPAYARIADPFTATTARVEALRDSIDVLVAITHLPIAQDVSLVDRVPAIDLIIGGHEHENMLLRRGEDLTPIAKADANARTVWVHDVTWHPSTRQAAIGSRLVAITDSIPDDPATAAVAERWVEAAFDAFRSAGFEPSEVVANVPVELDGLESVVRNRSTELTQLIVDAMRAEAGTAGAVVNSGSIRIDDVLSPGPLTQYDIIRILPFGGPVVEIEVTGSLLVRILDQGLQNRGGGGFLQLSGIERSNNAWLLGGQSIEGTRRYRIAVSDFLLTGREQGLSFLTRENPELAVIRELRDVRQALIAEARRRWT